METIDDIKPNITRVGSSEDLAVAGFNVFVEHASKSIGSKGSFNVAISGGCTPERFFELLGMEENARAVEWEKVQLFWVDERCVRPEEEGSNYGLAFHTFLNKVITCINCIELIRIELFSFYKHMTARQTLDYTARFFYKGPKKEIDKRVDEMIELVGLSGKADRPIKGFSGGEQQRLGIAQAEINYPDLLILDEALTGLDPIARREILRNIIDAMQAEGRTVLITGQDIADMERICDHIGFLVKGRLVLESTLDDLKARVKRIHVEHAPEAAVDIPSGALQVERRPRETLFTVTDFTPALLDSLDGSDRTATAADLSLEDIFVDLVQSPVEAVR